MTMLIGLAFAALAFIVGLGIGYRGGMDDEPLTSPDEVTIPIPTRRHDDAPQPPVSVYEHVSDMRRMFE